MTSTPLNPTKEPAMSRRTLLQSAAAGALVIDPALRAAVYAQGSDKPEKEEVKIGFIPLTDCASIVMASVLGIDKKYGVKIVPSKESSWASVRDKVINGENDFTHLLLGIGNWPHSGMPGPPCGPAFCSTSTEFLSTTRFSSSTRA